MWRKAVQQSEARSLLVWAAGIRNHTGIAKRSGFPFPMKSLVLRKSSGDRLGLAHSAPKTRK